MKVAILLLAAALGSASPVSAQNSIQARDGQNACDCSKPFEVFPLEIHGCPKGYKDISDTNVPDCIQIGCSPEDHKAKCDAKPQDGKPSATAKKPANAVTAPEEQKTCDCSKPFEVFPLEIHGCPKGYKDMSDTNIPDCIQIGCSSAEDHKAKCNAKPQDAKPQDGKPSATAEKPANAVTAPEEQKTCDCSKPFEVFPLEIHGCPKGYKDMSDTNIPDCTQIGCSSAEDHEAQCSSKNNNKPATAKSDCQAPPQI